MTDHLVPGHIHDMEQNGNFGTENEGQVNQLRLWSQSALNMELKGIPNSHPRLRPSDTTTPSPCIINRSAEESGNSLVAIS